MSGPNGWVRRPIQRRVALMGALAAGATSLGRWPQTALAAACSATSNNDGTTALMSDLAADAPGVNTHINYLGSVYDTAYDAIVQPRLHELGVRHIRDNPGVDTDATIKSRFTDLAKAGIDLLLIMPEAIEHGIAYARTLNEGPIQVVAAVEPPNERDHAWGATMPTQMPGCMMALCSHYRNQPTPRAVEVLGPSFANTRDGAQQLQATFADAAEYMDYGNIHSYSGRDPEGSQGGGWGISLADALDRQRLGSTKPVWASECGYKMSGSTRGHPAVTQRAAAKYLPRQFLSHMLLGAPRVFIYQLLNNNNEDFALLEYDGSPRLQFTAIKNFIAIFHDLGKPFSPGRLRYALDGDLSDIRQMLFQKRDGRFLLAVWQGVPSSTVTWSDSGIADLEPERRALTLNLGTPIVSAKIYEPSFSNIPVQSVVSEAGTNQIKLDVPDHVQVVELVPKSCKPA